MKKLLTLFAAILMVGFGLASPDDAEARRFGGGRNLGMQRQMNPQAAPRPAQKPAAAPAPQQAGGSKWMGPLAGLAAGGLLAALFMGGAFEGINMMDVLMLAALMGAVFLIVRMLRKPHPARPAMQYSGMNTDTATSTGTATGRAESNLAGGMQTDAAPAVRAANIPADFQVEPFLRNARTSFIRLQAASDAGDLGDIREYTTPEMFAEISMLINERGDEIHRTEVMAVDASLLEVTQEKDQAIASVHFTGQVREEAGAPPVTINEIWHVRKNLKDPDAVWLLAGIQQVS